MRLLVDNQLPAALARFLAARGLECQHVLDVNLAQATDLQIWRYAASHQIIVVSKDEDFFHLAARPGGVLGVVGGVQDSADRNRILHAMPWAVAGSLRLLAASRMCPSVYAVMLVKKREWRRS